KTALMSNICVMLNCFPIHQECSPRVCGCSADLHPLQFIVTYFRPDNTVNSRELSCVLNVKIIIYKRFTVKLHGGVQLAVWKADLTNFQVDAVVNAANDQLQHCGGLAQALSIAGGLQIQRDSNDYISRYGSLKTGDAIVFDAGSLPCKKIIHAVGPHLSKYPSKSDLSGAERLLERAIESILDKVKENHLQSVAIPAISSGLFNYPLPDCANTIVTTVKRYYESSRSSGHLPKDIFLVNNDEPTVKEMTRHLHKHAPSLVHNWLDM
uniref:Macro domain-containing protein n=1 Tax=Sander lucioperca TaxID=283035 RepID=A0A8D0ADQ2_SANLU